ncbi:hypothetical protein GGS23DRAFT_596411 [Durotheca rogersii]|uniref:uncharacterized protein n=1 Tax=Durotheca rogersii TaxID=419775 RepID=UPI00221FB26E|nr:uncharacterized protein GGS23DRAFT_596411 [Durotheca rogersii]KAI5863923.1 hypothetical protein GGS23DRAFT_596411 [Durotheca rogersii]
MAATLPKTYSAFRRAGATIEQTTEDLPADLGAHEVLIRVRAVSLNFRDVAMLHGRYPVAVEERGIAASDCAAEVVAAGPAAAAAFRPGDRVAPIFDLASLTGHEDGPVRALGGDAPGVLREYAVFADAHLVHLPAHLSWEEASTIACAGVTAWTALGNPVSVDRPHATALLQGTGGVSMFALLICLAAGIRPIITSSSDAKLAAVQKLSPEVRGVNYKTTPDVRAEALRLTDGRGVDVLVNNVGPASVPDDVASLRQRGVLSFVGFLGGVTGQLDPSLLFALMSKKAKIQGIGVGSKADFEQLNEFLEKHAVSLAPIIDRVFPFEKSKEAFDYLYSGKHVGKVVIKLGQD